MCQRPVILNHLCSLQKFKWINNTIYYSGLHYYLLSLTLSVSLSLSIVSNTISTIYTIGLLCGPIYRTSKPQVRYTFKKTCANNGLVLKTHNSSNCYKFLVESNRMECVKHKKNPKFIIYLLFTKHFLQILI